jgi:hypothetical protein
VSDLDATIDRLVAHGVMFTRYQGMDQDKRGAWTAPGGSRIAWRLLASDVQTDGEHLVYLDSGRLAHHILQGD